MKEIMEELKENSKCRSISTIVWYLVLQGMTFMVGNITEDELKYHKKIMIENLKFLTKDKQECFYCWSTDWKCLCDAMEETERRIADEKQEEYNTEKPVVDVRDINVPDIYITQFKKVLSERWEYIQENGKHWKDCHQMYMDFVEVGKHLTQKD